MLYLFIDVFVLSQTWLYWRYTCGECGRWVWFGRGQCKKDGETEKQAEGASQTNKLPQSQTGWVCDGEWVMGVCDGSVWWGVCEVVIVCVGGVWGGDSVCVGGVWGGDSVCLWTLKHLLEQLCYTYSYFWSVIIMPRPLPSGYTLSELRLYKHLKAELDRRMSELQETMLHSQHQYRQCLERLQMAEQLGFGGSC